MYNANAILMVYNKNKEDIIHENECPTCKRGFKDEEEKRRVVRAVEMDIEQLPARRVVDLETIARLLCVYYSMLLALISD